MKVELFVDPTTMAGQGFGSATGQYMDVYIKFDTKTLTGYALRIIRTTKFSNAVDFLLMKYEHGKAIPITDPISSICYRIGSLSYTSTAFVSSSDYIFTLLKKELGVGHSCRGYWFPSSPVSR